jgi:hypothetical protein
VAKDALRCGSYRVMGPNMCKGVVQSLRGERCAIVRDFRGIG